MSVGWFVRCAWVAVAAAAAIAAGVVVVGSEAADPSPAGLVIYERVTKTARWLEVRDLFGGSRFALTGRPRPGEIRSDCCATWSPDGTKVAFVRRTPKLFGLYVVNADGSHLHRVASTADLSQWITEPIRWISIGLWSRDGHKLLFSVDTGPFSCRSDGIYRVGADGSDARPLWRRPSRLSARVFGLGWSPDGDRALFIISHNDGDCYGSHIGPEELETVADDGTGGTTVLASTSSFGGAAWSPDGTTIAYASCPFGDICNLTLVRPDGRESRPLTHYSTRTSPFEGFDTLPFLWSGGGRLLLGRYRSVFSLDSGTGTLRRLETAPCLRTRGRCSLSFISLYGVSPAGVAVFDVTDVGCTLCSPPDYGPPATSERYALNLAEPRLVRLPQPDLPIDDVYLP